jgi:hypothetical protein
MLEDVGKIAGMKGMAIIHEGVVAAAGTCSTRFISLTASPARFVKLDRFCFNTNK